MNSFRISAGETMSHDILITNLIALTHFNPYYKGEIFSQKPWKPKVFFQFKIIINGSFIYIMLYLNVYVMGLRP